MIERCIIPHSYDGTCKMLEITEEASGYYGDLVRELAENGKRGELQAAIPCKR